MFSGNLSELENVRSSSFKGVYLFTLPVISYYNMLNVRKRKGYILMTKDRVLLQPFGIFFRKHSCLVHPVNLQINMYKSSGLISAWTEGIIHAKMARKYIRSDRIQMETPKKMTMNQFQGVVIICIFIYLMSGTIFAAEMLTVKFELIRKIMDFFTFK